MTATQYCDRSFLFSLLVGSALLTEVQTGEGGGRLQGSSDRGVAFCGVPFRAGRPRQLVRVIAPAIHAFTGFIIDCSSDH